MTHPFVWLNRTVLVVDGNFLMSAPNEPENFDTTHGAILGNPGSPVLEITAVSPVQLLIRAQGGDFMLFGDPAWPRARMYPFKPEREFHG